MLESRCFEKEIVRKVSLPYLTYLPPDYDGKKEFPLLVFLHGAGERGDDLSLVARHGPFKHAAAGEDSPFVMVGPQCPQGRYWGNYLETLNDFLDEILETYRIDRNRVYLTGLSMGGTGTWHWLLANPERFAAAAPVCGTGVCWFAEKVVHTPLWVFHGALDDVVPVEESLNMVRRIRQQGGQPKLTVYPDVGHGAWEYAYSRELTDWLAAQHR